MAEGDPATNVWRGSIDSFDGRMVAGWVRHDGPNNEGSPSSVDVYVGAVRVMEGLVPRDFRPDVAEAIGGSSFSGFRVQVPLSAEFDAEQTDVRLVDHASGKMVVSRTFSAPYSDSEHDVVAHIDVLDGREVRGWAKRLGNPRPVLCDVEIAGSPVATKIEASVHRPDLENAGVGNGRYGFVIRIGSAPNVPGDSVEICIREADGERRLLAAAEFAPNPFVDKYRTSIDRSTTPQINGWAVNENRPGEVFDVEVLIDGDAFVNLDNSGARADLLDKGISTGRGGVRFPNPFTSGYPATHARLLSFRLPDGSSSRAVAISHNQGTRLSALLGVPSRATTVVVPVYNAYEDLRVCLERLRSYTPAYAKVLVVDDCSTDERIWPLLESFADWSQLAVLQNDTNLGFTRTVNRAIAQCPDDDVVLLNSDARVTPGWLNGLLLAASTDPKVATVTAMSDRAGAFSAPNIGNDNPLPLGVNEITYARAFRRRSFGLYPRVPTGNGFCMWVSRVCLDEIGGLDEFAFPRGYGEENDFCMRAQRAGWINVIDDRTYVFHDRSKSFGESKSDLLLAGRNVVDERYPEYSRRVRTFREDWSIRVARGAARLAMADCARVGVLLPRVMYVVAARTGGTPQTNKDLMDALHDAIDSFVLRCDTRTLYLQHYVDGSLIEVRRHNLSTPLDPVTHESSEYNRVLTAWMIEFDIELVHIRQLAWHSMSLPRIAKTLGLGVVMSFHDFYTLSPDVKMIDDEGTFLGDHWRASGSVYRETLWPDFDAPLEHASWRQFWKDRSWQAIRWCDEFVTTSESARSLLLSQFTELDPRRFSCIEHGRDFRQFSTVVARPQHNEPVRILVPGNINPAKGLSVLREIADADTLGQVEFHILGAVKERFESSGSRIVYHGTYERKDFASRVAKIAPHAGIVLSIWDETYCHTLTEMWAVGLPAFVLDFPNVAQRVQRFGAGWVISPGDGASMLEQIMSQLYDRKNREAAFAGVTDWQFGWGTAYGTKQMGVRYLDVYRRALADGRSSERTSEPTDRVGVLTLASRDLSHAPASAYTRLWERTRNSLERPIDYVHLTPESAIASVEQGLIDALIVQDVAVPRTASVALAEALERARIPRITDIAHRPPTEQATMGAIRGATPGTDTLANAVATSNALMLSTPEIIAHRCGPPAAVFRDGLSDRLWLGASSPRTPDGTMRVLYVGHRDSLHDLNVALPALELVADRVPNFELLVVGLAPDDSHDIAATRAWLSISETPRQAQEYPEYVRWLTKLSATIDFAIAPLVDERSATVSDLKLLEYCALGLRTVASNVGPYAHTEVPGVVSVANSEADWSEALVQTLRQCKESGSRILTDPWLRGDRMISGQQAEFDAFVRSVIHKAGGTYGQP